jgi:hypothetical protein
MERVARFRAVMTAPALLIVMLGAAGGQETQAPPSPPPQEGLREVPKDTSDLFAGYISVVQSRWDEWQEQDHTLYAAIDKVQNPCAPVIATDIATMRNAAGAFFLALDNYRSKWASWIQDQIRAASVELPMNTDKEDYDRLAASLTTEIEREKQRREDATKLPDGPEKDLLIGQIDDNTQFLQARLANTKQDGDDAAVVAARRAAVRATLDERKARVISRVDADSEWRHKELLRYEALRSLKQLECAQGVQPNLAPQQTKKK